MRREASLLKKSSATRSVAKSREARQKPFCDEVAKRSKCEALLKQKPRRSRGYNLSLRSEAPQSRGARQRNYQRREASQSRAKRGRNLLRRSRKIWRCGAPSVNNPRRSRGVKFDSRREASLIKNLFCDAKRRKVARSATETFCDEVVKDWSAKHFRNKTRDEVAGIIYPCGAKLRSRAKRDKKIRLRREASQSRAKRDRNLCAEVAKIEGAEHLLEETRDEVAE